MLCKHEVTGSSPVISIKLGLYIKLIYLILCGAFVAQLVERSHGKGKVFGSSPTVGIKKEFCMISIQVTLKAFEVSTLKQQTKVLRDLCQPSELVRVTGLPSKKKMFTVLRSPHVHKKSREQLVMQIQKTRISIRETLTDFFKHRALFACKHILGHQVQIKQRLIYNTKLWT